jgi:penicillin-binding protein 1C
MLLLSFFFILNVHAKSFPTMMEVKHNFVPSDVNVLDVRGKVIERVRKNPFKRSLPWVSYNEVSEAFKTYLLKSEDKNFFEHGGVDWRALVKASFDHFTKDSKRGASTISMQLVGMLEEKNGTKRRDVWAKLDQVKKALKLDDEWTKQEIFEGYINLVPFRGELSGLRAASVGFFNKEPSALNVEESALLVALLRSPNADEALVARRACQLIDSIECDSINTLAHQIFSKTYTIVEPRKWLSVLDDSFIVKNESKDFIKTSIDKDLQETAVLALQEQIRSFKDQNVSDGAILVLDNKTKKVIVYASNAGMGFSPSPFVDGIRAMRLAGSTLKPFIYATAIDLNYIDQHSLVDDSPLDISLGNGNIYFPRNYDNSFKGLVSAGTALGSSLNVPAVKTLQLVTGERVVGKLAKLGFQNLKEASYYGPSLALGSVDVTLWDLTHAYQKLLTTNAFSKRTKKEIFEMLSNDDNRRLTFGSNSILKLPFPAAVKTGTSKDMRDNWCVGFTDQFTVGVWVGNFNGKAMWNVTGVTGAAPLWKTMMIKLHRSTSKKIEIKSIQIAQDIIARPLEKSTSLSQIRYPVDSEIIGVDPEIPPSVQMVPFEIKNPSAGSKIFLDKQFFSDAKELNLWSPVRGKHEIQLVNAQGDVMDTKSFEVR